MGSNYDQLFKALPHEPPTYLCERIFEVVERERTRRERVRLAVSSLFGMSSLVGLMFALPDLLQAASASGFTSYAPLLVSDSDLVVSHIGTFGLSILESLPGFEVTVTLFLLAVFLVSVKNFIQSVGNAHLRVGKLLTQ